MTRLLVRLVIVDVGGRLLEWRRDRVADGALGVRDPDDVVRILLNAVGVTWETYHYLYYN
jgi:hypothetical protein